MSIFGYQLARRTPNILVNGNSVLVTWDGQGRPYFECGRCSRRVKHIYVVVCRRCAGLDYASRHLHRSVPGVHRVTRWRRQIGIDPHPFAAIPERPKHHTRFHRIAARIRVQESELVGHLDGVTATSSVLKWRSTASGCILIPLASVKKQNFFEYKPLILFNNPAVEAFSVSLGNGNASHSRFWGRPDHLPVGINKVLTL